ncbi:MAG: radical SAM protein [Armatimonadetes bacterium]|nr:radical SAM protein [Armatimonadota bacterium]
MIGITKLYCGAETPGDPLRYAQPDPGTRHPRSVLDRRPIVVWNSTLRCNLNCVHCYADSENKGYPNELSTSEAQQMIRDLAEFGVPVLLFSGGEPLMREDVYENAALASELGIRTVISTNGTLITEKIAIRIKDAGVAYVGISLDGIGERNDCFRGKGGAFEDAVRAFENCVAVGQRVGLRLTLTRRNYEDLEAIFDFIEQRRINRACFYHLVYSGRGSDIRKDDLTHEETRKAVDLIIDRAADFHRRGLDVDILTVDNHCDGPYLYMRMLREGSLRAEEALELLRRNGGNSSGVGIAAIDNEGNVHADQFWRHYSFGNVRQRKFGEIWTDTSEPLMAGLKNRKPLLKGRCANCKWLDICNGNFRVRAEAVYGDVWAPDPACYLTDEEIGIEDRLLDAHRRANR